MKKILFILLSFITINVYCNPTLFRLTDSTAAFYWKNDTFFIKIEGDTIKLTGTDPIVIENLQNSWNRDSAYILFTDSSYVNQLRKFDSLYLGLLRSDSINSSYIEITANGVQDRLMIFYFSNGTEAASLRYGSAGQGNLFLGINSGYKVLPTAQRNVNIGNYALGELTSGDDNFCGGYNAGGSLNTGSLNVNIGSSSGLYSTSGTNCMNIGARAGERNASGTSNVNIGTDAGRFNLGSYNVNLGGVSGYGTVGVSDYDNNIFIGYSAGSNNETGDDNILIGYDIDLPLSSTSDYINIGGIYYGLIASNYAGINKSNPQTYLDVEISSTSTTIGDEGIMIHNSNGTPNNYANVLFSPDGVKANSGIFAYKFTDRTGGAEYGQFESNVMRNGASANWLKAYGDSIVWSIANVRRMKLYDDGLHVDTVFYGLDGSSKLYDNSDILTTPNTFQSIKNILSDSNKINVLEINSRIEHYDDGGTYTVNLDGNYESTTDKTYTDDEIVYFGGSVNDGGNVSQHYIYVQANGGSDYTQMYITGQSSGSSSLQLKSASSSDNTTLTIYPEYATCTDRFKLDDTLQINMNSDNLYIHINDDTARFDCNEPVKFNNTVVGDSAKFNSITAPSFNLSVADTGYYTIRAPGFISRDPYADTVTITTVISVGEDGISIYANVSLPDSVTVVEVVVYGNAGASAETYTLAKLPLNAATQTNMASANINTADASITAAKINNKDYSYMLITSTMDDGDAVYSARIKYIKTEL